MREICRIDVQLVPDVFARDVHSTVAQGLLQRCLNSNLAGGVDTEQHLHQTSRCVDLLSGSLEDGLVTLNNLGVDRRNEPRRGGRCDRGEG